MNFGPTTLSPLPGPEGGVNLNYFSPCSSKRHGKTKFFFKRFSDEVDIESFLGLKGPSSPKSKGHSSLSLQSQNNNGEENTSRRNSGRRGNSTPTYNQVPSKEQFDLQINKVKNNKMPDIQMINKYYGLVPKKFTVHPRDTNNETEQKQRNANNAIRRVKCKSAFSTPSPTRPFSKDPSPSPESCKPQPEDGSDPCSTLLQVQTTRVPMERQKRLLRHHNKGRSASLPVGSNKRDTKDSHNSFLQQRVIKIDLKNMNWEEEDEEDDGESISRRESTSSCSSSESEVEEGLLLNMNRESQESISRLPNETQTIKVNEKSKLMENGGESGCFSQEEQNCNGFDNSGPVIMRRSNTLLEQRGSIKTDKLFRKTISFDEGMIMLNKEEDKGVKPGSIKPPVRPMTANPTAAGQKPLRMTNTSSSTSSSPMSSSSSLSSLIQYHQPPAGSPNGPNTTTKVLPWTQKAGKGMTLAEKRSKLQKCVSIHSTESLNLSGSFLGTGEEESTTPSCPPTPNSSIYYNKDRNPKFLHPPPEVSTLVSQITPLDSSVQFHIEVEIEKVAVILKNMKNQNKSFIDLTPHGGGEEESATGESSSIDLDDNGNNVISGTISSRDSSVTRSTKNHKDDDDDENNANVTPGSVTPCTTKNNGQSCYCKAKVIMKECQSAAAGNNANSSSSSSRPVLRKAVSISCEKEVKAASGFNNQTSPLRNNSRPKTATNTSSSSRITNSSGRPTRTNTANSSSHYVKGESQGLNTNGMKNRVIIKKVLMEVINKGRPRTAPISPATQKNNNNGGNTNKKPLKPSPATGMMALGLLGRPNKSGNLAGRSSIPNSNSGKMARHKTVSLSENSRTGDHSSSGGGTTTTGDEEETEEEVPKSQIIHKSKGPLLGLHRQSFSLDEGMLLSFSNKEFGWDPEDLESHLDDETFIQSTKKTEQCLKIYQKMLKTGMPVKLDTIFRGMMTPSEYRVFITQAEIAAREWAEAEEERKQKEIEEEQEKVRGLNKGSNKGIVDIDAGIESSKKSQQVEKSA